MKAFLYTSRIIGFLLIFIFLVFSIGEIVVEIQTKGNIDQISKKHFFFYAMIFLASFGYFLAWRHEGFGGLIITLCAIALSTFTTWKIALPFFILGQLFVLYWFLSKRKIVKEKIQDQHKK
jgi:hypothetical protein